ncbi:SMC-Scp complex subunit ScpB [Chondromyces crocatus]|uniref:SMC-Scp complex subunit ScpB n=1 Tax=Chondromyces crocatus TaxID=52 RepID=UPI001FDEBBF5|nr:SMC-Scp complex subunit ScpB [Chondromyces crocatus]
MGEAVSVGEVEATSEADAPSAGEARDTSDDEAETASAGEAALPAGSEAEASSRSEARLVDEDDAEAVSVVEAASDASEVDASSGSQARSVHGNTPSGDEAEVARSNEPRPANASGTKPASGEDPRPQKASRRDRGARFRAAAWTQLRNRAQQAKSPRTSSVSPVVRKHLKGVLEALIFAAEKPMSARELARSATAELPVIREVLAELVAEYEGRGFRLDEVAGGYVFRTSPAFSPFVREVTEQKPVRMSRAQLETLAIIAYRQPITRPEVDEVRGVDSGAALKSLLERDIVRILGKKDEPGRPMIYGTTPHFLAFFGLRALSDLPTLREFTELSDDSRRAYERELGEEPPEGTEVMGDSFAGAEGVMQRHVSAPEGPDTTSSGAGETEGEAAEPADVSHPDELPDEEPPDEEPSSERSEVGEVQLDDG